MLDWGEEGQRTDAEIAAVRASFAQEVAVWHKLNHPNVTKVFLYPIYLFHLMDLGRTGQKVKLFIHIYI